MDKKELIREALMQYQQILFQNADKIRQSPSFSIQECLKYLHEIDENIQLIDKIIEEDYPKKEFCPDDIPF